MNSRPFFSVSKQSSLILPPFPAHVLIITDSLSFLAAIADSHFSHPTVARTLTLLSALQDLNSVSFMWIPNHEGIQGNPITTAPRSLPPSIHISLPLSQSQNPTSTCSSALSSSNAGLLFHLTKPTFRTSWPKWKVPLFRSHPPTNLPAKPTLKKSQFLQNLEL